MITIFLFLAKKTPFHVLIFPMFYFKRQTIFQL